MKKRISCPFCSEKIIVTAKKCRYCGEWLNGQKTVSKKLHKKIFIKPKYRSSVVLVVILFIFVSLSLVYANQINKLESTKKNKTAVKNTQEEINRIEDSEIIQLINQERNKKDLGILLQNEKLSSAAEKKAQDMLDNDYWSVTSPAGVEYSQLVTEAGYNYNTSSLLLAKDFYNSKSIVNSWMSNSTNKESILDPNSTRIGVSVMSGILSNMDTTIVVVVLASNEKITNTITKTQNTNNSSQTECIGPDGKHFNTTMEECKKLNEKWGKPVNYMTNCTFPAECGGGTKWISKSECDEPCKRTNTTTNYTQENVNSSNKSNWVAVYITSWNTTYYCPSELVDAVKTADTRNKTATEDYSKCEAEVWSTLSNCTSSCIWDHKYTEEELEECYKPCYKSQETSLDSCKFSQDLVKDGFMSVIAGCSFTKL